MAARPYQVVVMGATGFTGRLVCEHLARHYGGQVQWAMAGRSAAKLEQVKQEVATHLDSDQHIKDVPVLLCDAADQSSVDKVVSQAQVVLSTAGPFSLHGTPVVDAAVRHGTHYCDITGETWWVKEMSEKYHYRAAEAGVRLVNCCGYDSIPFDLGVSFVCEYIQRQLGKATAKVTAVIAQTASGVSGGTIASGMQLAELPKEEAAQVLGPYYLSNPPDERGGPDGPDGLGVSYVEGVGRWTAPSIMAVCNARVVRRSWVLLGRQWGPNFSYSERLQASSFVTALLAAGAMAVAGALLTSKLLLPIVKMLVPKPGQGPTREAMLAGRYKNVFVATTQEEPGVQPTVVTAEFRGRGDPGYYVTARWILEAALCMALQDKELKKRGLMQGGVLTPASAMGSVLIERLQAAGTEFEITSVQPPQ